ncbi:hypothetical protein MMC17_005962 [Xylographa soralifera]|nr:hypothetical protein [Xylographa soralifera]
MPIIFCRLCDLFSELEKLHTRKRPLAPKILEEKCKQNIIKWFDDHRALIDADDTDGGGLLSSLLPARRSDRVYGLKAASLTKILARCFGLVGTDRMRELERWKEPNRGDLGIGVEKVLEDTPNSVQDPVTIEQIDHVLDRVAARNRFSGPEIRAKKDCRSQSKVDDMLRSIYYRLGPSEAKWFTRMVLKDYGAVVLPEDLVFWCFHRLLPCILKVHDNFQAAVALLRSSDLSKIRTTPGSLSPMEARRQHDTVAKVLSPRCGVKVGRPLFLKAWSIKYALQLAHGRKMNLERKYDGEYCQIHVDLGKPGHEIQIFSKSGKDSTSDRRDLHAIILECLRIGEDDCQIKQKCILEGELLVWSTKESKILPFHKIRKHVRRSGSFLGTTKDSQAHSWEQLMIVFFDVLLVDEDPVLHQPHRRRRERLAKLITEMPGRAALVQCEEINFSSYKVAERLTEALANAFARRWEGCVLKPSNEPYVNFLPQTQGDHRCCWIKLKKDYIPGLGDTAEFAVVGAGYDASEAARFGLTHLPWTFFHIGALINKNEVLQLGAKPKFALLDSFNTSIPKSDLERLCRLGKFYAEPIKSPLKHELLANVYQNPNLHKMDVVFTRPFVFEVKGGGFDKPPNCDHFLLRFPRLVKIHWDRSFKDTVGFDELQHMAREAMREPQDDLLTEIAIWKKRVRDSDRGNRRDGSRDEGSEELESHSDVEPIPSSQTLVDLPVNMKTQREATFVRMDTSEMLPTEQRLDTGEIISQPLSSESTSTTESTSTFSSLPITSPPHFPGIDASNKISPPQGRKRSRSEEGELDLSPPPLKTLRKGDHVVSIKSSPPLISLSPVVRRPSLKDIANYAFPSPKTDRDPPKVSHKVHEPSSFTLVPKASPCVLVKSIQKSIQKSVPEPSSAATSTTESESSAASAPVSRISPTLPVCPRFAQSLTILSPCIAQMPYLTKDLLPSYNTTVVSISNLSARFPISISIAKTNVIVLVESFRNVATALFLKDLLPLMGTEFGEIEIWDWRIVEQITGVENRLGKWFVGWIRRDVSEDWVLVWKNGDVTKPR